MGGSSSKRIFFRHKKKQSPLKKARSQLKRVLPHKKRKKHSLGQTFDKLSIKKSRKDKHSKKKPSQKKAPTSLKRLSLGNTRKEPSQNESPGRKEKDKGGLERVGEQIKRKFSKDQSKELSTQTDTVPLSEEKKANDQKSEAKVPKKKLSDIIRSIRPAANGQKT